MWSMNWKKAQINGWLKNSYLRIPHRVNRYQIPKLSVHIDLISIICGIIMRNERNFRGHMDVNQQVVALYFATFTRAYVVDDIFPFYFKPSHTFCHIRRWWSAASPRMKIKIHSMQQLGNIEMRCAILFLLLLAVVMPVDSIEGFFFPEKLINRIVFQHSSVILMSFTRAKYANFTSSQILLSECARKHQILFKSLHIHQIIPLIFQKMNIRIATNNSRMIQFLQGNHSNEKNCRTW